MLYHDSRSADCNEKRWTSVEFAPGATTWSKKEAGVVTEAGVKLNGRLCMLEREVVVGGRAGVASLKLDLVELNAVLGLGVFPRPTAMQHEGAAKVLVAIAESTADGDEMSSGLRDALCEFVAVQWPRDSITMLCLRALQDDDDNWFVGFDVLLKELVDALGVHVDTPEFRWAVSIVQQWLNPRFMKRVPSYTPISPSMWNSEYLARQERMIARSTVRVAFMEGDRSAQKSVLTALRGYSREAGFKIVSPPVSPLSPPVKQEVVSSPQYPPSSSPLYSPPMSPFANDLGEERERVFHTRSVPSGSAGVKKVAAMEKATAPRRRRRQALVYNPKRDRKQKQLRRLAKAKGESATECVSDSE